MDITHQKIVDYWADNQSECGLSIDWAEAHKLCWRCAHKRQLQRCHIIPRSLGGPENPSNLVLLCAQCRSEAPNVDDSNFMWVWLRAHAVEFYGTYWYERGFKEYEYIFGKKPFSEVENPEIFMPEIQLAMKTYISKTSTHWGQGKINPATVAWLFHKLETELATTL
jgi:hypothetical protein